LQVTLEAAALEALLASGQVLFTHDTLWSQLEELVETRAPDRRLPREEIARLARAHAGDEPASHGTWVYYPWSRRLVHVLPECEYEELRTSRNRNKITRGEQTRLAKLRVGIVGLSVGQSTAVTLALEGVGGVFRLADFDTLTLSNMNRLRAGVHEIGVLKAVLVAREILEINPYARVEVFGRGIADDTLVEFFSDSEPLDLLFEECDDLKMKFRLRQEARTRGVPVLMETSDRGMLDIERFDREPARPLFHSLVAELDPERLAGMTTFEKVPVVLDILGAKTMSRRMAASLVDIDATLKTWPQLASAVALGGAINADAARRIALGKLTRSGRFFVDPETLVSNEAAVEPALGATARIRDAPAAAAPSSRSVIPLGPEEPISGPTLERLVTLAALAPSGGNCQPWRFSYGRGVLCCWHDESRSRSFLDFEHRATYVAFGALAENLRLSAASLGVGLSLSAFPDPWVPALLCKATLGGEPGALTPEDAGLARQVELRVTNRRIEKRVPLPPENARALEDIAARSGARLRLVTCPDRLAALGEVLGMADRLRLMSRTMHGEMMREVRWSTAEAANTRDGLDVATMELTPAERAAMRLVSDWSVMAAVREVGGGHGLAAAARKQVAGASALGLLTVRAEAGDVADAGAKRRAYFEGGMAIQRVWLLATKLGLAFHPMSALPYLFARLEDGGGAGFDDQEKRELSDLRGRYQEVLELSGPLVEVMLFRLTIASAPTARSLRRTVGEILSIETASM
jgi:molybdopterin/thiamine biosynthesis adenylyltransferase